MKLFSSKAESLMGIDISSTGIKLVELSGSQASPKLESMSMVQIPRDAIVENTIIDSMVISQALKDAVDAAKPSAKKVAFAVSGNAVIIKTVTMPVMSEFDLEAQIEFEADEYIPYDIEDVYLDFQILGEVADDPNQMEVVLAACKREVIDDYQLVLKDAGLEVVRVDCCVFCLENAAELAYEQTAGDDEQEENVHALVNIGANLININILRNGQTTFVRDQFFGGQNLTEDIQSAQNISFQAAEEMKLKNFSSVSQEALASFYEGLASELVRSLDFYVASHPGHPVQKLFVSGGCALIPGISDELRERIGIDTEVLNPFSAIKSGRKFDADYLQKIGPMMMVPVGLALRSFDE